MDDETKDPPRMCGETDAEYAERCEQHRKWSASRDATPVMFGDGGGADADR